MSIAVISYHCLEQASDKSKKVATRLNDYHNQVKNGVYRKLQEIITTQGSTNLTNARDGLIKKFATLETKSKAFVQYSSDLVTLKEKCIEVDTAVKNQIIKLTAEFKTSNGIVIPEGTIGQGGYGYYYNYEYGGNPEYKSWETFMGERANKNNALKNKFWQEYEGGKQLIEGRKDALLSILSGVVTVALAVVGVVTGGIGVIAIIGLVAGVTLGAIEVANGFKDWENEDKAYDQANRNGDPAMGKHYSKLNTYQDTWRATDDREKHELAAQLDIVNTVAGIASLFANGANLAKNIYKGAKGIFNNVNKIKLKNVIFKGKSWKLIFNSAFDGGLKKLRELSKINDIGKLKSVGLDLGKNFISNMKDHYLNFSSLGELKSFKDLKSLKVLKALETNLTTTSNIIGLVKDVREVNADRSDNAEGWKMKALWTGLNHGVFPGVSVFSVGTNFDAVKGKGPIQFEQVSLHQIINPIYQDSKQIGESWKNILEGEDRRQMLNKLVIKAGNVNIKTPRLYIPSVPGQPEFIPANP